MRINPPARTSLSTSFVLSDQTFSPALCASLKRLSLSCAGWCHEVPLYLFTALESFSYNCYCTSARESESVIRESLSLLTSLTKLHFYGHQVLPKHFSTLTKLERLLTGDDLSTSDELTSLYPFKRLTRLYEQFALSLLYLSSLLYTAPSSLLRFSTLFNAPSFSV